MTFKRVYSTALFLLSIYILVQRWALGQIPTQVGPALVYGVLLVNVVVIYRSLVVCQIRHR